MKRTLCESCGRKTRNSRRITERLMRKEQRDLQDAVAIQYAKMAMGETAREVFDTTVREALKPKESSTEVSALHGGIPVAGGDPQLANEW